MESRMTVEVDGTKIWRNEEGKRHRDNGPAVILPNGTKIWYKNDKRHRDNGPAVILSNGTSEEWFLNGQLHRDDGPAVIYPKSGTKIWYKNGKRHRDNGPAVIRFDSTLEWWLNNEKHSFTEWADKLNLDRKTRLEMVLKWNPV